MTTAFKVFFNGAPSPHIIGSFENFKEAFDHADNWIAYSGEYLPPEWDGSPHAYTEDGKSVTIEIRKVDELTKPPLPIKSGMFSEAEIEEWDSKIENAIDNLEAEWEAFAEGDVNDRELARSELKQLIRLILGKTDV